MDNKEFRKNTNTKWTANVITKSRRIYLLMVIEIMAKMNTYE